MSCAVISSPFHETSAFEEDWQKAVGEAPVGDLDLIAEFNASCDTNTAAFDDNTVNTDYCGGIDPQLLNNDALSPTSSSNVFDQAFGHDDFAYPDFDQPSPANAPYFHSVEQSCAPTASMFGSSPLRNQLHRRSVSEPPEAFPHHQFAAPRFIPVGPSMTFTRAGHFLGQPKQQIHGPQLMKSLPKGRQMRGHPYAARGAQQQSRYQLRRSNTQPMNVRNAAPTSVPQGMHLPSPPPPPPQHFTSSRVCTPAPSPARETVAASPRVLDPMLREHTLESKIVSIPVGVDELRSMITEAVRKAMNGIGAAKMEDGGISGQQTAGDGDGAVDEDEIVVASVEEPESEGCETPAEKAAMEA